jgi:hypothetical protein
MDFVALATESHRLLRKLDEMLGEDTDDPRSPTYGGAPPLEDTAVGLTYEVMSETATATVSRPIFSKHAEAELYLLATNFLLYVALVIVVIIVCRIYFPETLQSRPTTARRYSYRVAEEQINYEDESYGSDEEGEAGDEVLDSSDDEKNNFLEFQQESLNRKQVLQRLIFCCVMLNFTFVLWGVLQVC